MAQKNPFGSPHVDRMTMSQNNLGLMVDKKAISFQDGSKSFANGLYSSELGPNNIYEKSPAPYRVTFLLQASSGLLILIRSSLKY
jgi:hypothetical protein